MTLFPGQMFAGHHIEAVAGRGGMGVVYRARQLALDRTVALKLIAPELAADVGFRERLQRECRLLASIDHPNVITVYEAGEAEGQLFMSMRYVEGLDLHSVIMAEGCLAPEHAARIVADVAAGLDAAHGGGLVHRDVKPANVLIEHRDGAQRVYLSDFGLTNEAELSSAMTRSGQWVGTLDYVAPEQIEARGVDARSDVYALGCVFFQALTGRVPFVRDSDAAKLYAHLNDPAPSARELRPELPLEVDQVLARAMAKDPAQRYPSAGELGRAAIAAAGGEAITEAGIRGGEDTTAAAASRPWLRRRGMRLAAGVCSAVLLAVAGAAALVSARDDDPQKRNVASPEEATATGSTAQPATSSRSRKAAGRLVTLPGEAAPSSSAPAGGSRADRSTSAPAARAPSSPARKRRPSAKSSDNSSPPSATPSPAPAPVPQPSPAPVRRTACSDGIDNDGDGRIDFPSDPGCSSAADHAEFAPCSDGTDNDGDGRIDFPSDPGCSSAADDSEKS